MWLAKSIPKKAFKRERFDLLLLSPALHNLWLLLVLAMVKVMSCFVLFIFLGAIGCSFRQARV